MSSFILTVCNILLALTVGACTYYWVQHPAHFDASPYRLEKMTEKPVNAKVEQYAEKNTLMPTEEMCIVISEKEIFHPDRIIASGNTSPTTIAKSKINAQMSLIGTYSVGDSLGAIIVQKLQGNSAQILKDIQAQEYEAYQLSSRRTVTSLKDEKKDGLQDNEPNDSADTVKVSEKPAIIATNIFRQCLKVGDETINGYTLVEVTRTSARLTRKKETITLTLLSPTEARDAINKKANNNNNNNKQQQQQKNQAQNQKKK